MRDGTPDPSVRPLGRSAVQALAVLVAVLVGLGLLGSCAGERPSLGTLPPTTTKPGNTTTSAPDTTTSSSVPVEPKVLGPDDLLGYIATPRGKPVVRAQPNGDSPDLGIGPETEAGAPTTFAIVGDASPEAALPHPGWYEVLLPTRPNGATGWVEAGSVDVTKTPLRLFVDLGARELRLEEDGQEVFSTTVAIGTEENPTPTGATYVTELIQNVDKAGKPDPDGAYGPYAYGLALHSDTLTEFAGGDGRVGIHGTNRPNLIGQRVSHGCVRLKNEDVLELVDLELPLGLPVFIT